jgi:hypothetical protein
VWTPALTERWQRDGWLPVIEVWTAAQTARFLRHARGHRLYALFRFPAGMDVGDDFWRGGASPSERTANYARRCQTR